MGYKIANLITGESPRIVSVQSAVVRLKDLYFIDDYAPEYIRECYFSVSLDADGELTVQAVKETEDIFREKQIITSFWEGCILDLIQQSLALEISIYLKHNGIEYCLYDEKKGPPWRAPKT